MTKHCGIEVRLLCCKKPSDLQSGHWWNCQLNVQKCFNASWSSQDFRFLICPRDEENLLQFTILNVEKEKRFQWEVTGRDQSMCFHSHRNNSILPSHCLPNSKYIYDSSAVNTQCTGDTQTITSDLLTALITMTLTHWNGLREDLSFSGS